VLGASHTLLWATIGAILRTPYSWAISDQDMLGRRVRVFWP
jgi:hypothetical protein